MIQKGSIVKILRGKRRGQLATVSEVIDPGYGGGRRYAVRASGWRAPQSLAASSVKLVVA